MNVNSASSFTLIKRLWRNDLNGRLRWVLCGFVVVTAILSAIQGAEVYMISWLLRVIQGEEAPFSLSTIALFYLVSGVIKAVFMYLEIFALSSLAFGLSKSLREKILRAAIALPIQMMQQRGTSHYLSLFFNDLEKFIQHFRSAVDSAIGQSLILIAIMVVMVVVSPVLLGVTVGLGLVLGLPLMLLTKRLKQTNKTLQEDSAAMAAVVLNILRGLKQIKVFNRQSASFEEGRRSFVRMFYLERRNMLAASPFAIFSALSISLIIGAMVLGGGSAIQDGSLTIAQIASFFAALITAYRPLRVVSSLGPTILSAVSALERVYQAIDSPDTDRQSASLPSLESVKGTITFEKVFFAYETGATALNGIDLTIAAKETVALVGATGSGKSTLVNLIPRLLEPTSGHVLIDGCDVCTVNVSSLRQHIALVSQDVTLFRGTIRSNLLFARPEASDEDCWRALEQVGLKNFVAQLPEGLLTVVNEDGSRFSGGQRQLLSLARAFLRNSPILLFDEPTSSLDSESEVRIHQALDILRQTKTVIIVAHRLSTVRTVDRIIVLDKGHIVEIGHHDQLMQTDGVYARFVRSQRGVGTQNDHNANPNANSNENADQPLLLST